MKVLVLCNDYWHPGKVISDGLAFLEDKYEIEYYNRLDGEDPTDYTAYDVIVLARGNNLQRSEDGQLFNPWISEEIIAKMSDFVSSGGSLFGIHSGTAEYNDYPSLKTLLGGLFTDHPPQCDVYHKITADNNFTIGAADFKAVDEHYQVDVTDDINVFMESTSTAGTMPAGWYRTQGKGKVCVLTPGHTLDVWNNEEFKKLLTNCFAWFE